MPLLQLDDIEFSYNGRRTLARLSAQLERGQMVGLIGPNGAGKTTLLRLLMKLLTPDSGAIYLEGLPLRRFPHRALARRITLVPQDSEIGYPFAVEEIVAMGRNPYLGRFRPPDADDLRIVREAMAATEVTRLAARNIQTLSGGERQRVLVARAIAQQTPVILLDEATANLDLCHQLDVLEMAQQLARRGHLVIAAMHDLNMASRYCDRLLLLAGGTLVADGAPATVLTPEHLRRYFAVDSIVRAAGDVPGLTITPLMSVH
jgi:iron complex transport system ATP-binding protein